MQTLNKNKSYAKLKKKKKLTPKAYTLWFHVYNIFGIRTFCKDRLVAAGDKDKGWEERKVKVVIKVTKLILLVLEMSRILAVVVDTGTTQMIHLYRSSHMHKRIQVKLGKSK